MNILISFIITFIFSILNYSNSTELGKDILETLNKDSDHMKNFKENYRRMSCKLLVTSKLRAMFETEELDKYTNRTTPEARPQFLDRLKEEYLNSCLSTYKEDKIIFEKELFYSYPGDDKEYRRYLKVDLEELIKEYPEYDSSLEVKDDTIKNKKKNKENRHKANNEEVKAEQNKDDL